MTGWHCPVCAGSRASGSWPVRAEGSESGVDASSFRPSADRYGEAVADVLWCERCGHGSLAETPSPEALAAAYAGAADELWVDQEAGQVATADRGLRLVEQYVARGRLVDVGCWTGSLVLAAGRRGWDAHGLEPSGWAVDRARERGLDVEVGDLDSLQADADHRCVTLCDVIEHLLDPAAAMSTVCAALEPGGAAYLTTPDAGSRTARLLGRRWWSVLPMHVQYFTRGSMHRLLDAAGLRSVTVATHPKMFTAGYYADRLGGYSTTVGRLAGAGLRRAGLADRPVAPDLRDRMQVVAVKR